MTSEKKQEDQNEDMAKQLEKLKPKKKISISKDLLENANSYDDKLVVIKMTAEKEMKRVVLLIKNMLN
jgi:hypothetical protein